MLTHPFLIYHMLTHSRPQAPLARVLPTTVHHVPLKPHTPCLLVLLALLTGLHLVCVCCIFVLLCMHVFACVHAFVPT